MKFIVRDGFVIHDTRLIDINGKRSEQTNSYYEGNTVEFDEATARNHLHKLEPIDKSAREFLASCAAPVAPPVALGGIDPAMLAALVAQAVTAAMAAMQTAQASAQAPAA